MVHHGRSGGCRRRRRCLSFCRLAVMLVVIVLDVGPGCVLVHDLLCCIYLRSIEF